jgi:predicted alpha/beta-fold hydrolase
VYSSFFRVQEIDKYAVVAYNHFRDLEHYYTEMSALGDIPHGRDGLLEENNNGKIHGVSIPFCVLQAFDDPLISWRATANNEGVMRPENLVRTGSGHTMLLLTKAGGHVGWPLGILPFVDQWKWMSDAAMGFARAVDEAKRLRIDKAASEDSESTSTPDDNDAS